ncbi:DUF6993 domain-containing protein [Homoserinibacter sp. YIM 151385]|uniref:DUF6993 domain-containing protein n=1 Tax=Homoserinibacter sp. YIM 151385 TaxID=2985506 RepID=UPI0022F0734B|nr:hypothetical protein [Homoserinibacter sp. YIM 151385]WBU39049.1 hypothetical protein OF852_05575 [Homoserinibacter sp. YIM 151385]
MPNPIAERPALRRVRGSGRARSALAAAAIAMAGVLALAGCVPQPEPEEPRPAPTASGDASPEPDPAFDPAGGAAGNKAYFDVVNERTLRADSGARAADFAEALADAGFDPKGMEFTADRTSVDLAADSIQFSVLVGDGCLVGQSGPFGYRSIVAEPLETTGRCLVGSARTPD